MLVIVAVGTVVLWRIPWGEQILWPFTLLAAWYHEMGHAVAAMLLGGEAIELRIFLDGSGMAIHRGAGWGRLGQALVAAGGPIAPSLAGGAMIVCSRSKTASLGALLALGAVLAASAVFWVDWWESLGGAVAIFGFGAAITFIAVFGGNLLRTVTLQLCGVQACIALWRDWSYFFAADAVVGGEVRHSDAAAIADALWLPVPFWGVTLTGVSLAILLASLYLAFRPAPKMGKVT
jgi:hypothetical protein